MTMFISTLLILALLIGFIMYSYDRDGISAAKIDYHSSVSKSRGLQGGSNGGRYS